MKQLKNTYLLIDSGNFRKLEQVGPYLLDRPALQAVWKPRQSGKLWKTADAYYVRSKSGGGYWKYINKIPQSWIIKYAGLSLKVKLTDFGHLGFFPEHTSYWTWMQKKIRSSKKPVDILNLFAYTGSATLAAAAAGARITHLDAAKGIVIWARENAAESGLADKPIRWIVDDVSKFIEREIRRGNKYDAIILDPPSYGRGSKGEVWKFENAIGGLLDMCRCILSKNPLYIILSAHTPGFSPLALQNLLEDMMRGFKGKLSSSEMTIRDNSGRRLPSGIMATWENI